MSKMKGIKVEIGGPDANFTFLLTRELREKAVDYEVAAVYGSKMADSQVPPSQYLAVVDGVPITPWLSHRSMGSFLLAGFVYDTSAAEEVARYEQDRAWQASHRRGEWEL